MIVIKNLKRAHLSDTITGADAEWLEPVALIVSEALVAHPPLRDELVRAGKVAAGAVIWVLRNLHARALGDESTADKLAAFTHAAAETNGGRGLQAQGLVDDARQHRHVAHRLGNNVLV